MEKPAESESRLLGLWPELRGQDLLSWAAWSVELRARGRSGDALALARLVLERASANSEAARVARGVVSAEVPDWHWPMVADVARNAAYEGALRRAVRPGARVLDIGSGSGLLAMMAARAGAGEVVSCEMVPAVAAIAEEIVAANGLADRVRVVAKHSRDLVLGEDLGAPADVLVSEIVSNNLLAEDVLEVHADAVPHLLKPGGVVIPARATVIVALGWAGALERDRIGQVSGFDLSLFNGLRRPTIDLDIGDPGLALRSGAAPLFDFRLGDPAGWPAERAEAEVVGTGGAANAILQWIRLEMDGSGAPGSVYENRPAPGARSCWGVTVVELFEPVDAAAGRTLRIVGRTGGWRLLLWMG